MPLSPEKVRALRLLRKLSPQQAAKKAGMILPSWYAIERGDSNRLDCRLSTANKIAHALRCKVDDLLE